MRWALGGSAIGGGLQVIRPPEGISSDVVDVVYAYALVVVITAVVLGLGGWRSWRVASWMLVWLAGSLAFGGFGLAGIGALANAMLAVAVVQVCTTVCILVGSRFVPGVGDPVRAAILATIPVIGSRSAWRSTACDVAQIKGDKEALRVHRAVMKRWDTAWSHTGVYRQAIDRNDVERRDYPAAVEVAREGRGLRYSVVVPEGFAPVHLLDKLPVLNVGWEVIETQPGCSYLRHVNLTVVVPEWSPMGGIYRPEPRTSAVHHDPWGDF